MDRIMNNVTKKTISIVWLVMLFAVGILAQMPTRPAPPPAQSGEDSTMYYGMLFLLILGLIGAVGWWYKTKRAANLELVGDGETDELDGADFDADAEFAWLRKKTKASRKKAAKKKFPSGMPQTSKVLGKNGGSESKEKDYDYEETKRKLELIKFNKLPVNSFTELKPAKAFDALTLSNDEALMSAIEQTQDEYEEDEEIRDLALRILARFKTRNSVEALTNVALYDLAAPLRSKAVMILAEFDHESVFESILLACADPTREVRASSARALFQLNFNRADAWARISQSGDDYRIIQAARAAVESGLVDRSLDRLVHEDQKYAYEAFTLVALLVKANETEEIFQALESHRNKNVKLALLKVLSVLQDERVLPRIYSYIERNSLPEDLSNAANEVIKSCDLVPV